MKAIQLPKIKILNLRTVEGLGNIKAFADIEYQSLIIRDIKVIQQDGQKPYIRFPEVVFIGNDGKKHYKHILIIKNEKLKKNLNKTLLLAYYKELIKSNSISKMKIFELTK